MATDPAESTSRRWSTYRFLLKPKWIAFHLLVAALVVIMINLAFWQLRRLDERRQFNSQVRANANQPIEPINDVLSPAVNPSTVEWRRVRVAGVYVTGHQFLVVNRSQNGDTGRNVVDALRLAGGSLLLINRGFAPNAVGTPPTPVGTVEIVGRLRVSERRTTGQPSDSGSGVLNEIRRIDVGLLAGQFESAKLEPMYVEQLEATPADAATLQPIVAPNTDDEGPHLSYTIQWFIFSTCAIAGWVLAVRRSVAMRSGKPAKKRRSSYVPIAEDESVK
jgi:cytochrome oxidase assembly protein ShyY1